MKVFLSWSGELSHEIAKILRIWLPQVIQSINPYVSSDIDKGARWSFDIAQELEASQYGIICVTKDNIKAPWINFEAGALSKAVDKSKVCPLLFNMERSELQGPLLQFQYTMFEKEDFRKLIFNLNSALEGEALDEKLLENSFNKWWPDLCKSIEELDIRDASEEPPPYQPSLFSDDVDNNNTIQPILEEILDLVRTQHKLITSQDKILSPMYYKSFFEQVGKLENGFIVSKVIKDLVEIANQANMQASELSNLSHSEDVIALKSKIVSLTSVAKYLERLLPPKNFPGNN